MKAQTTRILMLALSLILVAPSLGTIKMVGGTPAQAQQAAGEQPLQQSPDTPTVGITPTMSYQGKLTESGLPVTGSRQMTFRLYDAATAGMLYWKEGPKTVAVTNGLFTVTLGDTIGFDVNNFSQTLYLEIEVAGSILPRQVLQGAPYAFSLAPGADVYGSAGEPTFYSHNSGSGEGLKGYSSSGHGLTAESNGSGINGAAMYARNAASNGIALLAENASASSSDTTMLVSNSGTGDLLKGFGGDGGDDEFRIKNDGTIQDKAPSYVYVPGSEIYGLSPDITISRYRTGATISTSITGYKNLFLPATLPAVLYGQPVEIEEIRVYYRCSSSENHIQVSSVWISHPNGLSDLLVSDSTIHNSTVATSYDLFPTAFQVLSADDGLISIGFDMEFTNTIHYIIIEGVRIKLRHHPLY